VRAKKVSTLNETYLYPRDVKSVEKIENINQKKSTTIPLSLLPSQKFTAITAVKTLESPSNPNPIEKLTVESVGMG